MNCGIRDKEDMFLLPATKPLSKDLGLAIISSFPKTLFFFYKERV